MPKSYILPIKGKPKQMRVTIPSNSEFVPGDYVLVKKLELDKIEKKN